jgi:sigma-54 specific flagellar transcriptional regulator A
VRELANLVERLTVIRPNGVVDRADLPSPIGGAARVCGNADERLSVAGTDSAGTDESSLALPELGVDLKRHLAELEQRAIEDALRQAGGVVQRAADALGIGRTTLIEKIRRYGLG